MQGGAIMIHSSLILCQRPLLMKREAVSIRVHRKCLMVGETQLPKKKRKVSLTHTSEVDQAIKASTSLQDKDTNRNERKNIKPTPTSPTSSKEDVSDQYASALSLLAATTLHLDDSDKPRKDPRKPISPKPTEVTMNTETSNSYLVSVTADSDIKPDHVYSGNTEDYSVSSQPHSDTEVNTQTSSVSSSSPVKALQGVYFDNVELSKLVPVRVRDHLDPHLLSHLSTVYKRRVTSGNDADESIDKQRDSPPGAKALRYPPFRLKRTEDYDDNEVSEDEESGDEHSGKHRVGKRVARKISYTKLTHYVHPPPVPPNNTFQSDDDQSQSLHLDCDTSSGTTERDQW